MALLPVHDFFVLNDSIQPNKLFIPSENEGGIYEVLRVVDGVPLFLEDHLKRFYKSAGIAGEPVLYNEVQIEKLLNELIMYNKINAGNILISCKKNLKAFFIPHNYPTTEMYENGVICGILKAERKNPNAKVFQTTVRLQADQLMQEKGFYEVLLVDKLGRVTEGSRSNVFFVKNNSVITPPGNEVLLGITRQKVFELVKDNGIECIEDDVSFKTSDRFEAAFLTGTSPKVLPLRKLKDINFDSKNSIVRKLMKSYDSLISNYISQKKIS